MDSRPIGIFDSGAGGISALKQIKELLPNENFIFYGDSLNAPYGNKNSNEVYKLSKKIIEFLITKNVKAIVIACNTATSAAKEKLQIEFSEIPIIGIEPALKEAVNNQKKNILVMGTNLTIQLPKYQKLTQRYKGSHTFYSLNCPGLAEYVESGMKNEENLKILLDSFLTPYQKKKVDSIVLGCTHYPFLKNQIRSYFSKNIPIFTGYIGVTKQLKKILEKKETISNQKSPGTVELFSSDPDKTMYYKKLLDEII